MSAQDPILFRYKAIRADGVSTRGVLSAYSETHLHEQLTKVDLELVWCGEVKDGASALGLFKPKIRIRDKIQLFKSLEQMQSAGIPLLSGLDHCIRGASNPTLRDVLNSIHRMLSEGLSLSECMSKYPHVFSKVEVSVINSKEKTGDLQTGFLYLSDYLIKKDDLTRKIKKATRYPTILLFVILVTIFVMLGYVTPQILGFVMSVKKEADLPFATQSLMWTSNFFQYYWYHILGVFILIGVISSFLYKNSYNFRYSADKFFIQMPVFGDLIRKLEISRFCATLSSLYVSGITLMECLVLSQEVIGSEVIKNSIDEAIESLSEGASLHLALNETGEFPSMVIQMIGIAEESGNMAGVLEQVVEFYEKDIDDAISSMITMIEPMLTMLLAIMICWIAAAVFGPIYDMFGDLET